MGPGGAGDVQVMGEGSTVGCGAREGVLLTGLLCNRKEHCKISNLLQSMVKNLSYVTKSIFLAKH